MNPSVWLPGAVMPNRPPFTVPMAARRSAKLLWAETPTLSANALLSTNSDGIVVVWASSVLSRCPLPTAASSSPGAERLTVPVPDSSAASAAGPPPSTTRSTVRPSSL